MQVQRASYTKLQTNMYLNWSMYVPIRYIYLKETLPIVTLYMAKWHIIVTYCRVFYLWTTYQLICFILQNLSVINTNKCNEMLHNRFIDLILAGKFTNIHACIVVWMPKFHFPMNCITFVYYNYKIDWKQIKTIKIATIFTKII